MSLPSNVHQPTRPLFKPSALGLFRIKDACARGAQTPTASRAAARLRRYRVRERHRMEERWRVLPKRPGLEHLLKHRGQVGIGCQLIQHAMMDGPHLKQAT